MLDRVNTPKAWKKLIFINPKIKGITQFHKSIVIVDPKADKNKNNNKL
jgi:hypothetical protein